jgi:PIN domain
MTQMLFIDANQYLDLYRVIAGKKLLDYLETFGSSIFVTKQISNEVQRRKLGVAHEFFSRYLKDRNEINLQVPDHLLGLSEIEMDSFRKAIEKVRAIIDSFEERAVTELEKISKSEDEVSIRLMSLLSKAIAPTNDEMRRARDRKEIGNPPGKRSDPLGDQLSWEQLLSHCILLKVTQLWIVSKDSDYLIMHKKKAFINPLLRQDLLDICGTTLELYCFDNLVDALKGFGEKSTVPPEQRLSEQDATEIKKELEELPQQSWTYSPESGTLFLTGTQPGAGAAIGSVGSFARPGFGGVGANAKAGEIKGRR